MSRILPETVPSQSVLPSKVDVVVIGGGIAGVTTALELAERGISVALCEKGVIAGEQSGRNWGWTRQMGRDVAELPLTVRSLERWRGMNARIGDETGFRETGIAYLCRTAREEATYRIWLEQGRAAGVQTDFLTGEAMHRHIPGMVPGSFKAALHAPTDGRAEPWKAVPAMARAAARAGAHILTSCAVRAIERSAGRVSGVVTEHGPIACSAVVLAGGAWSRLFAGNAGIDLPQLKIIGSVARVSPVAGMTEMPVGAGDFAFRRRLDGGFSIAMRNANIAPITPDSVRLFTDFLPTLVKSWREMLLRLNGRFVTELRMPRRWADDAITPFEQVRIVDPAPTNSHIRHGLANLTKAFPAFAEARLTHSWAGLIDVTPDAVPVIGPVAAVPGFFIASGFSGHGFGIGPGAGELMADLVAGTSPCVDPAPFRFDRFARAAPAKAA